MKRALLVFAVVLVAALPMAFAGDSDADGGYQGYPYGEDPNDPMTTMTGWLVLDYSGTFGEIIEVTVTPDDGYGEDSYLPGLFFTIVESVFVGSGNYPFSYECIYDEVGGTLSAVRFYMNEDAFFYNHHVVSELLDGVVDQVLLNSYYYYEDPEDTGSAVMYGVYWHVRYVIPEPETGQSYGEFVLTFDGQNDSLLISHRSDPVPEDADPFGAVFDTGSVVPEREGYVFKGWSSSSGDSQEVDIADEYLFVPAFADRVDDTDPELTVYHKTVYAVWEASEGSVLDDISAVYGDVKDWIGENIWIAVAVLAAVLLSAALLWRRS